MKNFEKKRGYRKNKKLTMTIEEKQAVKDKNNEKSNYKLSVSAQKANTKALEENRVPSSPTASSSSLTD